MIGQSIALPGWLAALELRDHQFTLERWADMLLHYDRPEYATRPPPSTGTREQPGTPEKIKVYRQRDRAGLALDHPDDPKLKETEHGPPEADDAKGGLVPHIGPSGHKTVGAVIAADGRVRPLPERTGRTRTRQEKARAKRRRPEEAARKREYRRQQRESKAVCA